MSDVITDNLAVWTAAIEKKSAAGRGSNNKQTAYGIKKLRELILELAVRGKLVPQDPNDEPAGVLLEKIAEEKARLIKEGKIKKQKALPEIGEDEKLFELQDGWVWTKLGNISEINPRNVAEDEIDASFIPMSFISNSHSGSHDQEIRTWGLIKKGYTHFADSDIGLAKITPCFENGKAAVFSNLKNGIGAGTTELHIARPFGNTLNPRYILIFLKAPQFLLTGEKIMTGTAGQKRVPKDFFAGNPLPLPPLSEQHRIVAKVDELMVLCDQLEQQQTDSIVAHQTLVATLLQTLTDSENAEQLAQNWTILSDHFGTLFTTEPSIDQLKQTLLQLAVMGKLAPQDPNDEPAGVLLEKIAEEKARLIQEGKLKKQKALPGIEEDEKPFELPDGWAWGRLGNVTNYGVSDKVEPNSVTDSTWVLELEDVEKVTSKILKKVRYSERNFKSSKNCFRKNDVIYGKLRPYLDKVLVADEDGVCTTEMIPLRGFAKINPFYLRLVMKSPFFIRYANDSTHGMNLPRMGTDKARMALFPITSESEQHRIVAKVDELMALCDQLKAKISQAQATQILLADAIVEQAIA